jgi:plasmid stabilization system protein ParE
MLVRFLEPAQVEFDEAVAYYESREGKLGSQFAEEVKQSIERILKYPEAWSPLSPRTRRCLTPRFPYGVVYQVRGNVLLIVAVMHLQREPATWKSRLREIKES